MAIEILNKKQTGSSATATLTITSATKGSILVAFIAQTSSSTAPTCKDNIGGTWTTNATKANGTNANNGVWVATKTAEGGETKLEPTVGSGGTLQGISYWELGNCTATFDTTPFHVDNPGSVTTSSIEVSDVTAGCICLGGVAGVNLSLGVPKAWEGSVLKLANNEELATRCMSGAVVTTGTTSTTTISAAWTTNANVGLLGIFLRPLLVQAVAGTTKATLADKASTELGQSVAAVGKVKGTGPAALAPKLAVAGTAQAQVAGNMAPVNGIAVTAKGQLRFVTHQATLLEASPSAKSQVWFVPHANVEVAGQVRGEGVASVRFATHVALTPTNAIQVGAQGSLRWRTAAAPSSSHLLVGGSTQAAFAVQMRLGEQAPHTFEFGGRVAPGSNAGRVTRSGKVSY